MTESCDLVHLEAVIKCGFDTFVEVGEALSEIRDRQLYRIEHATFADYCKVKWGMSDRRARQLMDASEVVAGIAKSGTIVPKSEAATRPLTKLPPEQRTKAWKAAVVASPTGKPTAREVQAVVLKASKPPNGRAGEAPDASAAPLDGMTWLQTATFAYRQMSAEDRQLFRNFQATMDGIAR